MENNLVKELKLLWSGLKDVNGRNLKMVHGPTIHKTSKTKITHCIELSNCRHPKRLPRNNKTNRVLTVAHFESIFYSHFKLNQNENFFMIDFNFSFRVSLIIA